nr:bifunctional fucokinase/fucose pyrophosphorylase [Tanacetum cinerariifolium]
MTGDVLPCFDASAMVLPEDTSCIITVPITLDISSNHEELSKHDAILDDGRELLDTGIIAVRGKAWVDLVTFSCLSQPMISELLNTKKEMSLYEDLVAAWVPAKHDWSIKTFGQANWLMGLEYHDKNLRFRNLWRMSRRVSLEELHRSIDFPQMCLISSNHQADLATKIARACLTYGLLGRNLSQLCQEISQIEDSGEKICAEHC